VKSQITNHKSQITNNGVTLVELIIVMSMMGILLGLVTIALSNVRQRTTLTALTQTFVSDIRQQQIKAMAGDTQGGGAASSYGVRIDANSYVLFRGATYNPIDTTNFTVDLEDNFQFISPGIDIVFLQRSGEILIPTSVGLQDTTNSYTKTIQLNRYGVVTGVN
jgi:prepilin-type N-terminal cleavage/methylation domain-containing protein